MTTGKSVPDDFTLPHNTEWTMADAWGLTERQCQNISFRTSSPPVKHRAVRVKRTPSIVFERRTIWNDDMIARLKQMYAAGYSFASIAKSLGFSRSAVAGKVKRLRDKLQL